MGGTFGCFSNNIAFVVFLILILLVIGLDC
jgi:hypothetical protein